MGRIPSQEDLRRQEERIHEGRKKGLVDKEGLEEAGRKDW